MTMSTDTVSVMTVEDIEGVPKAVVDRHIELFFELMRADIADSSVMNGVPNRASLALIPDDPELAVYALLAGLAGFKRGRNIYFLHVTHDAEGKIAIKWPEENPMSDEDDEEPQETNQGR